MQTANVEVATIRHGSPEYRAAVALRAAILRQPLGLAFSADELSAEAKSHHIVCYGDGRLVGCLVLTPIDARQIQMRQVAIEETFQRRGIGRRMVQYAENLAGDLGYQEIILHARETVVPFYERLGYAKSGDPFTEVTLPHWLMTRPL